MTENNNHLLVHNFVCWQFGQGSTGRCFCWSLLGSAMCQKLSESWWSLVTNIASLTCLVVSFGCQLDTFFHVVSHPQGS